MKKIAFLFIAILFVCISKSQVRTPTLYVSGTVLSNEKMLVTVRGTNVMEGNVVSAELNGKKTHSNTDKKGHTILDFSTIAGGMSAQGGIAVIKTYDKNGTLLNAATTTVVNGSPGMAKPIMNPLSNNLAKGDVVTITGHNLGADAKLNCGEQIQETLSASDKEMNVLMDAKPGVQPVYVITPNGVSKSQMVNVYSLDFNLPKSSIKPKENVQAQVHYESIPEGTKLIFTNKSPETVKMTIPGAENTASECVYSVTNEKGNIPVNITGILNGNFTLALNTIFPNEIQKDSLPPVMFDEKPADQPQNPVQPPQGPDQPKNFADTIKIKTDVLNAIDNMDKMLNGQVMTTDDGKPVKVGGISLSLNGAIGIEQEIIAAEKSILNDKRFSNVVNGDPKGDPTGKNPGDMQKAKENIEKALEHEAKALESKRNAANDLSKIKIPKLKEKINRAKNGELKANELKNGTKEQKDKAKTFNDDAIANEKEALKLLNEAAELINKIKLLIGAAKEHSARAIDLKGLAAKNIEDYLKNPKDKKDGDKAKEYLDKLKKSQDDLKNEEGGLDRLSGDLNDLQKQNDKAKADLEKIVKK